MRRQEAGWMFVFGQFVRRCVRREIAGLEDHSSDFTGLENRFQARPFHVNHAILRGRNLLNAFTGGDFCWGFSMTGISLS
ncbi:hypothetical protein [Paraburkholderia aromaticivorans]|uniref:hypothetical protein n=1 Tax=Paraburkholderia aromaticivorans TaxID=2026199 RepID=UPI001455EE1C|nr:hypothetical protein [Paraburkholderia aromaticivorans]